VRNNTAFWRTTTVATAINGLCLTLSGAAKNIEVLTRSEVTALEGCDGNLETARWRHIFGWYFPFRVAQLRDARARGGKLSTCSKMQ
jgi:hypothetical protein